MRLTLLFSMLLVVPNLWAAGPQCVGVFQSKPTFQNSPLITIISGTNRRGSESMKVALKTKEVLESKGARVRVLDLVELPMDVFSPDNYFGKTSKDFKTNFEDPISQADALVVVIPSYNESMPGILKMFFDYSQADMLGKPVAAIGISDGQWGARNPVSEFTELMSHLKATVLGEGRLNIPNVKTGKDDTEILNRLDRVADAVIKSGNVVNEKVDLIGRIKTRARISVDSGLEVRGLLFEVIKTRGQISYVKFEGPTEILFQGAVLPGHGKDRHHHGFGMPIGVMKMTWNPTTNRYEIKYDSGLVVEGAVKKENMASDKNGNITLMTFTDCTVTLGDRVLFEPTWGEFDLLLARSIRSADAP